MLDETSTIDPLHAHDSCKSALVGTRGSARDGAERGQMFVSPVHRRFDSAID